MLICGNCGSTNSNNEKSCKKCGVPLKILSQSKVKRPKRLKIQKNDLMGSVPPLNSNIAIRNKVPISESPNNTEVGDITLNIIDLQPIQQKPENLRPIPSGNIFIPGNQKPALIPIKPNNDGKNLIVPHPAGKVGISKVHIPDQTNKSFDTPKTQKSLPKILSKSTKVRLEKPYVKNLKEGSSEQGIFKVAMTEAMRILQRDLGYIFQEQNSIKRKTPPTREEIQFRKNKVPASLADILENLWDLDLNIIVSALVHVKGDILALVSSREVDEILLSTIGNTLGNISQDMIHSLDGGDLKYISLNGTKGIIFMAPVMKNVFLFLLTTPESKSGVINIAKIKVKKLLTLYFADKNLKKTAL